MHRLKGKSKFEEFSFLLRNNKAVLIIVVDSPLTCHIHIHVAGFSHKFHGRTKSQMKKKQRRGSKALVLPGHTVSGWSPAMEDVSFFLSAVYVMVLLKYSFLSFVFPGGSVGKESACNAGDLGLIFGLGKSPGGGHGNPLQYSCLENPHGQRSLVGYSP